LGKVEETKLKNTMPDRIASLIAKQKGGVIAPEEENELQAWIDLSPDNLRFYEERMQAGPVAETMEDWLEMDDQRIWGAIEYEIKDDDRRTESDGVIAMPRRRWVLIAAAIILALLPLLWLLMSRYHINKGDADVATAKTLAGYRKAAGDAILVLGNDKPISLDRQKAGEFVNKYGVTAVRTGKYIISLRRLAANDDLLDNVSAVVSVPYGQSWDVTLPDGTFVKLGPGTVLSMLVQTRNERKLELDGEAFFEVAKDKNRQFKLSTTRGSIEVLGTSFNVSSFSDETRSVTTLISGKVNVRAGKYERLLLPGDEACVEQGRSGIQVVSGVDTADRLAWRSPYFNFTDANIPAVMRQVQRWYGMKNVVYRSGVDTVTKGLLGGGHIGKDISLHRLLEELGNENHISFSIHDKTIIVGPMAYTSLAYVLPLK
jgi:ferric-dicitrate binding protein FerR (iron transport regulator)